MDETQARLAKCFSLVFPSLGPDEVIRATPSVVENWDSVASVTLLMLIEEEFGINIDMEILDEFVSFERILGYLQRRREGTGQEVKSTVSLVMKKTNSVGASGA